ncbi:MAG TPA: DUF882 domain-containing protein [Dissulfurispiraceae bacterium]|nr:DUF882 domain-containing protein [Dissulfurispiraceae bacterium]
MHIYNKSLSGCLCDRRSFLKASFIAVSALITNSAFSDARQTLPEGKLTLLNIHTNDKVSVRYRHESSGYDAEALKELNWVLRCHYTGEIHDIDTNVIEIVNLIDKRLGGNNEICIISGYRSPEYNRMLISEGRHVVKNSMHLQGKAMDIRIPGVDLCRLRDEARKLKLGGVGYYKESNFVHVDCGRIRTW